MEARLAGPCPPPNSEREKKFQEGNEYVSSLCMLVCKVWIKMIRIELQLHSELGMSGTMFLLFASAIRFTDHAKLVTAVVPFSILLLISQNLHERYSQEPVE